MKLHLALRRQPAGSTLVVTVVITALIGLALAAYLGLITHQNAINFRSQAWNSTMPVLEAGLEHALAHLNANVNLDDGIGYDLARDGWSTRGNTFVTTNSIGADRYEVIISRYVVGARTNAPEVESFGYVAAPMMAVTPAPGPFLAVAGVVNSTPTPASLIRAVRIRCKMDAMYSKGLVARDTIDLNGNSVSTDSFDSTDPNLSDNGQYTTNKWRANGDIATNSGITNSLRVGNANIFGHIATGPEGSATLGPGGRVGDTNWVPSGTNQIQPGWYKDDMNVEFQALQTPFDPNECVAPLQRVWITNQVVQTATNTFTSVTYPVSAPGPITTNVVTGVAYPVGSPGPVSTNLDKFGRITGYTYPVFSYFTTSQSTNDVGVLYDYVLDNDNYTVRSLAGKTYIRGKANLYVQDRINMTGSDVIEIGNGGTLKLYMAGADASIGGNGVLNHPGFATNFSYYGLPSNTSVSLGGNMAFIGTINAPSAVMTLNGGGNADLDFIGAGIAQRIVMNGHFRFHYDEALAKWGPIRGYVVASWKEMSPSDIRARTTLTHETTGYPTGEPSTTPYTTPYTSPTQP